MGQTTQSINALYSCFLHLCILYITHVLYMGISHSRSRAHRVVNSTQSIKHWPFIFFPALFKLTYWSVPSGEPESPVTSSTSPIMPCELGLFSSLSHRFFVNIDQLTAWNGRMETWTYRYMHRQHSDGHISSCELIVFHCWSWGAQALHQDLKTREIR